MVSLIDSSEAKEVSPGYIVERKFDDSLGTSIFLLVLTKAKKKEIVGIPAKVEGDWEKAEVLYFFSKKGYEIFMDSIAHLIEASIKRLFPSAK
ncbi:MAG: hypothetical protein QW726_05505, partial [Fervidicoccaceae archaeon]